MNLSVKRGAAAFTLVELLVAAGALILLIGVMFSIIHQTGTVLSASRNRVDAFQSARAAFDRMTRTLSQATLNTYYDYFDAEGRPLTISGGAPDRYGRQSDLHFIAGRRLLPAQIGHAVFFQAPMGLAGEAYSPLPSLLNNCGYFVRFSGDGARDSLSGRPEFLDALPERRRYQLMEFSQPAEEAEIYEPAGSSGGWYLTPLSAQPPASRVLAENVIFMVLHPKAPDWETSGREYEYDSRRAWNGEGAQPAECNQLCPIIEAVLMAIDEPSALRMRLSGEPAEDFGFSLDDYFQDAASMEEDVAAIEKLLAERRISYRTFATQIALSTSKWSAQ